MDFTANDVIKLIKICRKQGISEFSLGELKLSFGQKVEVEKQIPANPPNPEVEAEMLLQHEYEVKQAKLDELRLSDPYSYEQMICNDNAEQEQSIGAQ